MAPWAWATTVPLVITILTAAIGMWASTFPPAPEVIETGAWSYATGSDPIALKRLSVIATGLIAPVFVGLFAIGLDPRDKRNQLQLTLVWACVIACFAFGWRNTPYWANGVYRTDLGESEYMDMDPKALPPMTWIGGLWRIPVLFFPLVLFATSGAVFPLVGWAWLHERARVRPLIAIFVVGFAWTPLFWRVKDYTVWLMD